MGASPWLCCFLCSARGGKPLRLPTHIHTYLPRTTLLSRLSLPGTSPQHVQGFSLSQKRETNHKTPVGPVKTHSREKDRADPTHARDARDGARVVSRVCSRAERSRKTTPKNAKISTPLIITRVSLGLLRPRPREGDNQGRTYCHTSLSLTLHPLGQSSFTQYTADAGPRLKPTSQRRGVRR